jgi:hypothetical protein
MNHQLPDLRSALLELHKALIEAERVSYEKAVGPIRSPNHFLQLLTGDPYFAWLHPLSQLIVAIDEALDGKEPLTAEIAGALADRARHVIVASDSGEGAPKRYAELFQRSPEVVMAHAKVRELLGSPPTARAI